MATPGLRLWSSTSDGSTGRGDLRGPDLRVVDLVSSKDTRLGGSRQFELRLEMFNLFNRANFGGIRNTVTSARQGQLGVRVRF
ncbi:MAG: hypothetical protein CK533_12180 [Acidobacterium sp.]|nr:hypothetical protein [Acidobacteriota bacterium]PHY09275.1 MAG: hypothetical protein CK533_12180 [Acidobacterium sp.]